MALTEQIWKIVGIAILPVRFVQGWIFWGGGSRRFIYDPAKLDPHAHTWIANKFQSAMPGALLGLGHVISFMIQHFTLLYASVLLFSLLELLSGLALIVGCCTRLAALMTIFFSIILMLIFGWQGATCIDEWTMAAANLAIGITLLLSGASVYSIDSLISRRLPSLAQRKWFPLMASGPLSEKFYKRVMQFWMAFLVVFVLLTYNYYRGSILTPYHSGPVSVGVHHITLTQGEITADNTITFTLYVDGGTPALPVNIIRMELLNAKKEILSTWTEHALSVLPEKNIRNIYLYDVLRTGQYGLVAPMSAKAIITLPLAKQLSLSAGKYELVVYTIEGQHFNLLLQI